MTRTLLAAVLLLGLVPFARAQDMPLSQILIDGEGWKKVEGKAEKPEVYTGAVRKTGRGNESFIAEVIVRESHTIAVRHNPGQKQNSPLTWIFPLPDALKEPSALAFFPDGATLLVGDTGGKYIWAFSIGRGRTTGGEAYCPLRLPPSKNGTDVTSLVIDTDGRIYAATEIGVQVFDPTGRLCGVLTPAAPGKPKFMAFEGDQLTLWIENTKYTRKLNTTGAK
jgi:SMP-30/Gluconolactonase/LRE-like region